MCATSFYRSAILSLRTAALLWLPTTSADAQDRLRTMPGFAQFQRVLAAHTRLEAVFQGIDAIEWSADGSTVTFSNAGVRFRHDLALGRTVANPPKADSRHDESGQLSRTRQHPGVQAPAGNRRALYRDRNVWLGDSTGGAAVPITSEGSGQSRVKYGSTSWVYGEELSQRTAMWWSPDGERLAYYRFDESMVPDYHLAMHMAALYDSVETEAYPKAGLPNPVVDIFVYDVASKQSRRMDVRAGDPYDGAGLGYYVFRVAWSPDGRALTLFRTNRRQNALEFVACDPTSGACRVVVHEEVPTGWIDTDPPPTITWLSDGNRFLIESDRSGFKNYDLYDFRLGTRLVSVTRLNAEVAEIVRVDEPRNLLYYMARDGGNYMKLQLHRVALDGSHDERLTDTSFTHTIVLSPDAAHFVDVAEAHNRAPVAHLMHSSGTAGSELARVDVTPLKRARLKPVEMFSYRTSDGEVLLHGLMHFPSTFDPRKKYPVLVSVYGGPGVENATTERFQVSTPMADFGFIVLEVEARTNPGLGRRAHNAVYRRLGEIEQNDMTDGVKAVLNRVYVDRTRVGIFGVSYGGYTSVMQLLRHPEIFSAAAASSPVTDWRNYDTIYTERYMGLPEENPEGYAKAALAPLVNRLRGKLLLYFATADNNVHPSNALQLIEALQKAGKSFELQIGPDLRHSSMDQERMMEFFIDALGRRRER